MSNEKKKKILIVHNYYQIPGGEDTVVANEKEMLEDNGHEIIFYSRSNVELNSFSKLQKLFLPITTVFNPKTYRDIKRIIKEQNIAIVHVHNTLNLISPAVYYAAFSRKIPVVQTIHNFRLLCPGATFYRDGHICEDCIAHGLNCAVKHRCYRGNKLQTLACVISMKIHRMLGTYGKLNYICLTEFNKEKLIQLEQIKPDKVCVKPNFVKETEGIIPYEERANQFVYVGRIDELKGIEVLFESWRILGEEAPELVVCGTGPMEEWCKEYIDKNKMKKIQMLGFMANTDVKKIISNSKALILPTQWYEGFPMTIVEAYSVGTPVIGSDIGNVASLIEEGKTGCKFISNNPAEVVQAIRRIETYQAIGITTKLKYDEEYTDIRNYEILMKFYNELIYR